MKHNNANQIAAIATILLICFFLTGSQLSAASPLMKTIKLSGDEEVFMLKELGAIITGSEDSLEVIMVMPPDMRTAEYKSVDLQTGDIIMMFNGKRMKSSGQMEETYNALAVGDEIKLGARRGKDMLIVSLKKADPADLSGQVMMLKKGDEDDDLMTVLVDAGLLLEEKNGKIIIKEVIEGMDDKYTDGRPAEGDIIFGIQGRAFSSPEELEKIYSAIKADEQVFLTLERNGLEVTVGFKKQSCSEGKPMMIKKMR